MEKSAMSGGFAGGWRFEKCGVVKNVRKNARKNAACEKVMEFADLPLKNTITLSFIDAVPS
ncbi:MAG: hypothetical protein LBM04_09290 [Opitutaceae bacterium]|jgi:hypothetical protein|nr:hypothetical protein [Opitutaceae bacterium]